MAQTRDTVARTVQPDPDVVVVGAGPTGLTVANLLGVQGVSTLLIERNAGTSDQAKAISLDDDAMRTLQAAGLDEAVRHIVLPGTGTRYYDRHGRALLHAGAAGITRNGYAIKSPFAQPDLERVLLAGLTRFPHVRVDFGTQLTGLDLHPNDGSGVSLEHTPGPRVSVEQTDTSESRAPVRVHPKVVLGCDGGRSTVRQLLGIGLSGRSYEDQWLVIDTTEDPHRQRYGMHHGDPARPHVIVPGRDGRCRYEFRLLPGERAPLHLAPNLELIQHLLEPHRTIEPHQIERAARYSFHALVADRWREGRCLLLGDAAHMMPPFAGQGLNSGLRDAANAVWKVAAVCSGEAEDELLATYESERRPHAQAMVSHSARLGAVVMTTSRRRAIARDTVVRAAVRLPPTRKYLRDMKFRPPSVLHHGFLEPAIIRPRSRAVVGTPLAQPRVLIADGHRTVLLDEVMGQGFALVGVGLSAADWHPVADAWPGAVRVDVVLDEQAPRDADGRIAVADVDGTLQAEMSPHRGLLLLVRPDRYVCAAVPPAEAAPVLAQLRRRMTVAPGTSCAVLRASA